jgi:hypothetical protein
VVTALLEVLELVLAGVDAVVVVVGDEAVVVVVGVDAVVVVAGVATVATAVFRAARAGSFPEISTTPISTQVARNSDSAPATTRSRILLARDARACRISEGVMRCLRSVGDCC